MELQRRLLLVDDLDVLQVYFSFYSTSLSLLSSPSPYIHTNHPSTHPLSFSLVVNLLPKISSSNPCIC
jgi:hypothetical protein